jgi:hypothetical protein
LQVDVEAGGDAEAARGQQLGGVGRLELAAQIVGEVGRGVGRRRRRRAAQRLGQRRLVGRLVDRTLVAQQAQHHVAPLAGALRRAEGRVHVGGADQSGEQGDLADRQLVRGAGEVEARRLPDAEHALDAVLAQVDLVQVGLEQLVLVVAALGQQGHRHLDQLAAHGALLAEEEVLHQLLGEGRAALDDAAAAQVGERGAQDADRVDAVVVVEAPVLDQDDRARQQRRQRGERHFAARLPGGVEQPGHYLRLEGE